MNNSPKALSLLELQEASLEAVSIIIEEVKILLEMPERGNPDPVVHTLRNLVKYLSDRSQAVSMLVSWGYAWDAEIILRSFYETAAKILFICFANNEKRQELVNEFWLEFETIHSIKIARKAEFSKHVSIKEDNGCNASIFSALQDPELYSLDAKHTKNARKIIEQRWSFTEIIETLSKTSPEGKNLADIKCFLHIYGMASHLIHADKTAMEFMTDRSLRNEGERKILEASHAGRIFSDQVSLWLFCADAIRGCLEREFVDKNKVMNSYNKVIEMGKPFSKMFADSQEQFYREMGHPYGETSQKSAG